MGAFGTEDDKVGASAQQEDAVRRFKQSLTGLAGLLEEKQNYDPRQPRRPKGTPIGGQWAPGDWSRLGGPSAAERGADMAAAAARFDAFVLKHHREIARVLGAVQALGGTAEAVGSIPVAVAGAATSETGVGLLGMALAGWMASTSFRCDAPLAPNPDK